jgi:hypothetical protein
MLFTGFGRRSSLELRDRLDQREHLVLADDGGPALASGDQAGYVPVSDGQDQHATDDPIKDQRPLRAQRVPSPECLDHFDPPRLQGRHHSG